MCEVMDKYINEVETRERISIITNMIIEGYSIEQMKAIGFSEEENKKAYASDHTVHVITAKNFLEAL